MTVIEWRVAPAEPQLAEVEHTPADAGSGSDGRRGPSIIRVADYHKGFSAASRGSYVAAGTADAQTATVDATSAQTP